MNKKSLLSIYYSLFHSHLQYFTDLWVNTYMSNMQCITILQNIFIRVIYYLNNRTNIGNIYIHKLIIKFKDIIYLNTYE